MATKKSQKATTKKAAPLKGGKKVVASARAGGAVVAGRTATQVLQDIALHADNIKNDADVDASNMFTKTMQAFAQGDVYIVFLGETMEAAKGPGKLDAITVTEFQQQLAPGDTQGSRHELAHADGVVMYRRNSAQECDGPILHLTKPNDITHPEHGNLVNIPPGVYGIVYQQTGDQLRRRVRD